MKILFVLPPGVKDYRSSGDSIYAVGLAKALQKLGESVDFVADEKALKCMFDDNEILFHIHDSKIKAEGHYVKKLFDFVKSISNEYDVIHFHIWQNTLFKLLSEESDMKCVYTRHFYNLTGMSEYSTISYKIQCSCFKNNIRIAMPSQSMKLRWLEHLKKNDSLLDESSMKNVSVAYGAVFDLNEALQGRKINKQNRNNNYLSIGRIFPDKRMLDIAKAFYINEKPIKIIGCFNKSTASKTSKELEYFNNFEEICNKAKNIEYVQYMDRTSILNEMFNAKAYITMSKGEVCPLTVLEALELKTPILHSEEPAICEMVNNFKLQYNVCSHIVEDKSVKHKSLNSRVKELINCIDIFDNEIQKWNYEEYDYKNIYSINSVTNNYLNLYQSLL